MVTPALTGLATGGWAGAETVIDAVAGAEVPAAFVAVYRKLSEPL
jgi:hypothetical protein